MYVRDAKKRDEVWLLDRLEDLDLADPAFRSRDYVIALDEETGEKAGFGRLRFYPPGDPELCEVTAVGVLEGWRNRGVGAHVVERLVETARDQGFEAVYTITEVGGYCAQFGFDAVDAGALPDRLAERLVAVREAGAEDAVPMALAVGEFEMPRRLRERFKRADDDEEATEVEETPEDFGIDPDSATYKYDTGR